MRDWRHRKAAPRQYHNSLRTRIKRLQQALEPFQRKVEAESLAGALGHIERKHLWNARRAYVGAAADKSG
jgi:hypothetical protein